MWAKTLCVYVCLEFALRGVSLERGVQRGLGEGPIRSGSNVQTPQYHWYRVTHARSYSRTYMHFPSQLYSRQLRVSFFLMFRGAVTHQAHLVSDFGLFLCSKIHFYFQLMLCWVIGVTGVIALLAVNWESWAGRGCVSQKAWMGEPCALAWSCQRTRHVIWVPVPALD